MFVFINKKMKGKGLGKDQVRNFFFDNVWCKKIKYILCYRRNSLFFFFLVCNVGIFLKIGVKSLVIVELFMFWGLCFFYN